MRKSVFVATVLMLGGPFAGAVGSSFSFDPWLSKETGVTDVSLGGDWQFEGGSCFVTFAPHIDADYVYGVVWPCEGDNQMGFTMSLHRLDGTLLLVVGPESSDGLPLLLPVYLLFKVELDNDTMTLFSIDEDSFAWRAAGASIEHKDSLVLSSTEELVSFLSWQVGDPSFFEEEPDFTFKKMESD